MNKRSIIIGISIAAILLIVNIFIPDNSESTDQIFRKTITKNENVDSTLLYRGVFNGLARISKDGISFYDDNGELKWINPYTMKEPICDFNEKYIVVANKGGNEIYLFNKNGLLSTSKSEKVIDNISLSKDGFIYALLEDEDFTYVNLFDSTGKLKDISIKYSIEGEGYPLDISTSPDATELMVSLGYINNNEKFSSKVLFYNFDEVGKNISADRIVGNFTKEYEDYYVAKTFFSDNTFSQCFYDGGVDFFSSKILTKIELIDRKKYDKKIKAIDYCNNFSSIIFEDKTFLILDSKGNEKINKKTDFNFEDFYIENSFLILQNQNEAEIYNNSGTKIYKGKIPKNTIRIKPFNSIMGVELLIGTNNDIYKLKVK